MFLKMSYSKFPHPCRGGESIARGRIVYNYQNKNTCFILFFIHFFISLHQQPSTRRKRQAKARLRLSENSVMLASTLSSKSRLDHRSNSLSEGWWFNFRGY